MGDPRGDFDYHRVRRMVADTTPLRHVDHRLPVDAAALRPLNQRYGQLARGVDGGGVQRRDDLVCLGHPSAGHLLLGHRQRDGGERRGRALDLYRAARKCRHDLPLCTNHCEQDERGGGGRGYDWRCVFLYQYSAVEPDRLSLAQRRAAGFGGGGRGPRLWQRSDRRGRSRHQPHRTGHVGRRHQRQRSTGRQRQPGPGHQRQRGTHRLRRDDALRQRLCRQKRVCGKALLRRVARVQYLRFGCQRQRCAPGGGADYFVGHWHRGRGRSRYGSHHVFDQPEVWGGKWRHGRVGGIELRPGPDVRRQHLHQCRQRQDGPSLGR